MNGGLGDPLTSSLNQHRHILALAQPRFPGLNGRHVSEAMSTFCRPPAGRAPRPTARSLHHPPWLASRRQSGLRSHGAAPLGSDGGGSGVGAEAERATCGKPAAAAVPGSGWPSGRVRKRHLPACLSSRRHSACLPHCSGATVSGVHAGQNQSPAGTFSSGGMQQ